MRGSGTIPGGYRVSRIRGVVLVASPEAEEPAGRAIAEAGSLLAFAAGHPERSALGSGRGVAYAAPFGVGEWVVRHYRRGGAVAPLLGDRYLRGGVPRPLSELQASAAARERGIPTPRVVALTLHPAGPFYRADIATERAQDAFTLASALFGPDALDAAGRAEALAAAGRLVRGAHERGLEHADLNLQNILLQRRDGRLRALVLDLDRCRVRAGALPRSRRDAELRRFRRSIRRWEERTGRALDAAEREAFTAAYEARDG